MTRLARSYSGLPDSTIQSLFHSLKREGLERPVPTQEEFDQWRSRTRSLIHSSRMSERLKSRSEHDLFLANEEDYDGDTFYALANIERRARQQAVIRSLKGNVTDLTPPGSQLDMYEWGPDGRPARVWYASYGSNMARERFLTYIEGGTPQGSASKHEGCRDSSLPQGDIPIRYRGRMHFAYESRRWESGGVAFLDNDGVSHALGRAYNVSMEQFDDIVAQENGGYVSTISPKATPAEEAILNGSATASHGVYGTMVHIGDYDGAPVFTFTGDFTASEALEESWAARPGICSTNEPSPNYIRMVGSGLQDTFGMSEHEQADYLRGCPGMEDFGRRRVLKILRTPPEPVKVAPRTTYSSYSGASSGSSYRGSESWMEAWDRERGWGTSDDEWDLYSEFPSLRDAEDRDPDSPVRKVKTCFYCGGTGHKMNDCPKLKN